MNGLAGCVALVTGASRGIGKGVALELGAAGATVYVTARSVEPGDLPGSVGETAGEIDALGGRGIPVACDHRDDTRVGAVLDRIGDEHGRLDVLVNNVFSVPDVSPWIGRPFWELPIAAWDQVIDVGLRSHYVASRAAVPLMLGGRGRLIVNVSSSGAVEYSHMTSYGVGKAGLDKLTSDSAHELRPHGVAVVSVWPGLVRTETLLHRAHTTDDGRRVVDLPGMGRLDLARGESPRFMGRAVVALATDPDLMTRSGRAFRVSELAREYGFHDVEHEDSSATMPRGS